MRIVSDVLDLGDAAEFHLDGVSGVYRVSRNTVCIELYANKIVDGEVKKVVVLRNTWDRSQWLTAQMALARIFNAIAALPEALPDTEMILVH